MFRTINEKIKTIASPAGSKVMPKRIHKIGKHGEDQLETVGFTDIYEERQASKDSVDIGRIVERYLAGDVSALDKSPGLYLDLTVMPEDLHEMKNLTVRAEEYFKMLPKKERDKYEDVEDFLKQAKFTREEPIIETVKETKEGGEKVNE